MKTDPQVPGTASVGGVSGALKQERAGNDLYNIIERVVVKTCFKGGLPGSGSRDAGAAGQSGPSVAPTINRTGHPCPDASVAMTLSQSEDQLSGAMPGSSAMEGVKRFISVLDKIYAKVLSDGEFDYIGFMRARSLGNPTNAGTLARRLDRAGAPTGGVGPTHPLDNFTPRLGPHRFAHRHSKDQRNRTLCLSQGDARGDRGRASREPDRRVATLELQAVELNSGGA